MIIYVDENMSPYLAKGFDILQQPLNLKIRDTIQVRSIKDAFGPGAPDEDWNIGRIKIRYNGKF